jgi:hypothetical protein
VAQGIGLEFKLQYHTKKVRSGYQGLGDRRKWEVAAQWVEFQVYKMKMSLRSFAQ